MAMRWNRANPVDKTGASPQKGLGLTMKLTAWFMPLIVLTLSAIVYLVYANTSQMILAKNEEKLQLSTASVVNQVNAWTNRVLTALDQQRDTLQFFSGDSAKELDYIKHTADQYDAFPAGIYLGLNDGSLRHASFVPGPDFNVFEKSWYNDGLLSEAFMLGAIYFDEDSQSYVVGASGMLRDGNGVVRGVAAADIYLSDIANIVAEVRLEQSGGLFLVDKDTGMLIGHRDKALLGAILSEQQDTMYVQVGEFLKQGTMGLQTVDTKKGDKVYLDLQDVPNTRWAAVSYVPAAEVMADLNGFTRQIVVIAICSILLLVGLVLLLLRRLVIAPVREIDKVARRIAQGNLEESISYRSGDELGELSVNFNQTVARLRDYVSYIDEISAVLEAIAAGKLNNHLRYEYTGEFAKVKQALEHITASLNETLGHMQASAEEVSEGAEQLSAGSQALSQGATEQAAAVEELAATIRDVSEQMQRNAARSAEVNRQADVVGQEAEQSNRRMQDMLSSMEEIRIASGEIAKIIKVIEDIALQTNLLALNAAVEAARAGIEGKGFAVVAQEVRMLANKSHEASKTTASLIENALRATEHGTQIADETALALRSVVSGVGDVSATIAAISQASDEQAQSVSMIHQGVEQISAVVHTNSATAEESAAASETLFAQSESMKRLVARFQVNEESVL